MKKKRLRFLTILIVLCMLLPATAFAEGETAEDLTPKCKVETSYGGSVTRLIDNDPESARTLKKGQSITIEWSSDVPVRAVYLELYKELLPYTVEQRDASGTLLAESAGELTWNALVEAVDGARSMTFSAGDAGVAFSAVTAYGEGEIPNYHPWKPTVEKTDFMLIAMHPDDDVLFLGAMIPTYGSEQGREGTIIYVASRVRQRISEGLNGAWTMGLRTLPVFGGFPDIPNNYYDEFKDTFKKNDLIKYFVQQMRAMRPEVVITQDLEGEYGHWQHKLMSQAVLEAVPLAADASYDPASAEQYGAWEVKKLYIHLYPENKIFVDATVPLTSFGGKTAKDVATEAFACHQSQLPSRHSVSNEGIYSLSDFGLAYTTVGQDTPGVNDMFEHIDPSTLHSLATPEPTPTATPIVTPTPAPSAAPTATPMAAPSAVPSAPSAETPLPTTVPTADAQTPSAVHAVLAAVMLAAFVVLLVLRAVKGNKRKKQGSKKKKTPILIVVIAGAVLLLALILASVFSGKVFIGGEAVERDIASLSVSEGELPTVKELRKLDNLQVFDLSAHADADAAYVDSIRSALPKNCKIIFSVKLTDGTFKTDTTELTLPNCTADDLAMLAYFTELKSLDASGSKAVDALYRFAEKQPTIVIRYTFPVGSKLLTNTAIELTDSTLTDGTALLDALRYFPLLTALDLTDAPVSDLQMLALREVYPKIDFRYTVDLSGKTFDSAATEIDLAGVTFADANAAIEALSHFASLTEVDLRGTGLDNDAIEKVKAAYPQLPIRHDVFIGSTAFDSMAEEIDLSDAEVSAEQIGSCLEAFAALKTVHAPKSLSDAEIETLAAAHPDMLFAHDIILFEKTVSNAAAELDLSKTKIADPSEVDAVIAKMPRLQKLILCECDLTNEQMESLIEKHPTVRFVWTVKIGPHKVRTDAIAFSTKNPSKYTSPNASDAYNRKVKTTKRLYEGDIEALKYCTDLEALDLGHNYLTNADLEVIAGLTNLKVLILADNKITDISALSALTNLEYFEIFMNVVKDVSPIAALPKLQDVNICNIKLEDFSPLYSMQQVKRLWFAMNPPSRTEGKAVAEALPDCVCNYTTTDETSEGWREHERYDWMHAYFYGE